MVMRCVIKEIRRNDINLVQQYDMMKYSVFLGRICVQVHIYYLDRNPAINHCTYFKSESNSALNCNEQPNN